MLIPLQYTSAELAAAQVGTPHNYKTVLGII